MTISNKHSKKNKALGEGPNAGKKPSQSDYKHATGGWGATLSVASVILKKREPLSATKAVFKMNHENGGFDCPGCAWPDDRKGLRMDICENGINHSTSEMTRKACDPDFFAKNKSIGRATYGD